MRPVLMLIALPAVLSTPLSAAASTPVSGPITADTTWTLANSPYTLTGDVTVQNGATLTIEPGVEVVGSSRLIVLAASGADLRAQGTASSPITFGRTGAFGGLLFTSDNYMDAADSVLDYVEMRNSSLALDLQAVSVPISNVTFTNNSSGIFFNVVSLSISDATFTDHQGEAIRGMARGQINITHSAFWNNGTSVAILAARTCSCNTARWDVHLNDFLRGPSSGQYDMTVGGNTASTSDTYDASSNWWGTTDGVSIQARIYDGVDDGLEKTVTWSPPSNAKNTAFTEPSPQPSPPPPGNPPPEAGQAARALTLALRKHLVARGMVSSEVPECTDAPVEIQRRASGGWTTIRSVNTLNGGTYRSRVPDREGRYRAVVEATSGCQSAASPARRHSHARK